MATGDPLYGEYGPKGTPPSPPPIRTKASVPPVPTANSASSNAALASNSPLPGGKSLAINQNTGTGPQGGYSMTGSPQGAGAMLRRPEPIVQPLPPENAPGTPALAGGGSGATGFQTTGSWGTSGQAPSYESLQEQLRARGVLWHKQDTVPEGVRFSCIVPNRQNPQVSRVYEATARDYPTAVLAVLQQIDQQR